MESLVMDVIRWCRSGTRISRLEKFGFRSWGNAAGDKSSRGAEFDRQRRDDEVAGILDVCSKELNW